MEFINNTKIYACFLFNSICNNSGVNIICDLFKIHKSTLYRWINEYNNIDLSIDSCCHFDFNSILITKEIVIFVLRFFINNANSKKNTRILMKKLNIFFPDNKISYKHINIIVSKNNHLVMACDKYKSNNIKITVQIENFIIEQVKNNNLLVANDIKNLVFDKFNINVSLPTIYNIFKKNNYTYKKTKININPYTLDDQKMQLTNVYNHLKINNNKKDYSDEINHNILVSIDEMSIITNRAPSYGWSLKNSICEIHIPFIKPNVRYSLLMASSNAKIIKYKLVKGSIKSEDYINFIIELNQENPNYSFLIDNASIHKSKKARLIYKEKKINIIYNAPYKSEFNPIEMIFSLLRKKLNKKIVKNEESILEVIKEFEIKIKKEELENIFNHCEENLKQILKI
jgi:transposase